MRALPIFSALVLLLGCLGVSAQSQWFVRPSGTTKTISSIAFGNGVFLATDGRPLISEDGIHWSRPAWPGTDQISSVFFGGEGFVALGDGCTFVSTDGRTAERTAHSGKMFYPTTDATGALVNGRWTFTGFHLGEVPEISNPFFTLAPGKPASVLVDFPSVGFAAWAASFGDVCLASSGGAIFTSTDGIAWSLTSRTNLSAPPLFRDGILYTPSETSSDMGKTWTPQPVGNSPYDFSVATQGAGQFVAATGSIIFTSLDGLKWTRRESGTVDWLFGMAFGNDTFVAVGDGGRITTSSADAGPIEKEAPELRIAPAVLLKWPSKAGLYYQPQSSADLKSWSDSGDPIPGTGGEMSRAFETGGKARFFRLTVR